MDTQESEQAWMGQFLSNLFKEKKIYFQIYLLNWTGHNVSLIRIVRS